MMSLAPGVAVEASGLAGSRAGDTPAHETIEHVCTYRVLLSIHPPTYFY